MDAAAADKASRKAVSPSASRNSKNAIGRNHSRWTFPTGKFCSARPRPSKEPEAHIQADGNSSQKYFNGNCSGSRPLRGGYLSSYLYSIE